MSTLRTLSIVTIFILSACATPQTSINKVDSVAAEIEAKKQRELVVQDWVEADQRLFRIGYPILVNSISFCEKTSFQTGMIAGSATGLKKEWEEAFRSVYGLSDILEVTYIAPGAAAAVGGLKIGDVLITVNDWSVPVGKTAKKNFDKNLKDILKNEDPIEFKVRRDENDLTLTIYPEKACDYQIVLDPQDDLNAFADGKTITFHKGLMDFFRTDQEVVLVFSHELAHNTMKHVESKTQNAVIAGAGGFIVDLLGALAGINTQGQFTDMAMRAGGGAFSAAFEAEADYVGLYIMAASGHEIEKSSHFWRRMSLKNVQGISMATSHPSNADRFVGIENTIKEIKVKIAAGEPLEPEMKNKTQ